jgi:hypothetical protein
MLVAGAGACLGFDVTGGPTSTAAAREARVPVYEWEPAWGPDVAPDLGDPAPPRESPRHAPSARTVLEGVATTGALHEEASLRVGFSLDRIAGKELCVHCLPLSVAGLDSGSMLIATAQVVRRK